MRVDLTISAYSASQANPIELSKGDRLIVGEEYWGNPNWVGRTQCTRILTGQEGWLPDDAIWF